MPGFKLGLLILRDDVEYPPEKVAAALWQTLDLVLKTDGELQAAYERGKSDGQAGALQPSLPGVGTGSEPIDTDYGEPPLELQEAIKKYWPRELWAKAAAVSFNESGWRQGATADTRYLGGGRCGVQYNLADGRPALTEYSVGPWQINLCVASISEGDARDYDASTKYAYELYTRQGWGAWYYTAKKLGLL